ncbi:ATP-binding cassette domain-containing protein [Aerococcus urinaeequi]|uniref:ATP-binding cassette domain-containing protein n=1 Tax=Aerococcus urinaeequi TaxID=51665 RepID=UPI003D6B310A
MELQVEKFSYNRSNVILNDVKYSVTPGKINFLIGSNGTGKTTLLDIFVGLLGSNNIKKDYQLNNDYIYINQFLPMLGKMSCKEIIQLILGTIYGELNISKENLIKYVDKANLPFLLKYWDTPYKELSGGEGKLLQLLLFLETNKSLIVMDEPTAFLDRKNVYMLFDRIKKNEMATYIIVTHDYRDLLLCDDYTVTILDNGMIAGAYRKEEFEKENIRNHFISFFKEI